MAFPGILRMLFENDGAGPLLRRDKLPVAALGNLGAVSPDNITLAASASGVLKVKTQTDISQQTLSASGNWTAPYSGYYLVEIQGAGGGAGSIYAASPNTLAAGGASSGQHRMFVKYYAAGTVVPCTIGAKGLGGTPDSSGAGIFTNATAGGNTTFDGTAALGGLPSASLSYLGTANLIYTGVGADSVGLGSMPGGNSTTGYLNRANGNFGNLYSGAGADSALGNGGGKSFASTSAQGGAQGNDATGYGAGGGGAVGQGANYRGGNGAPGCVRITFLGV